MRIRPPSPIEALGTVPGPCPDRGLAGRGGGVARPDPGPGRDPRAPAGPRGGPGRPDPARPRPVGGPPGRGPAAVGPAPRAGPGPAPDRPRPVPAAAPGPAAARPGGRGRRRARSRSSSPCSTVPPRPPPLPADAARRPMLPDSAFGTSRSTQIRGPVGVLGPHGRRLRVVPRHPALGRPARTSTSPCPRTLLWKIPLANPREPRFYGKFFNLRGKSFIDTAIGAEFGLGRVAPKDSDDEGIQLDVFAVVFTRFDPRRFLTAVDYRAGIPLTYKKGPWSTKLSYEHTSTHIGDEFSQAYRPEAGPAGPRRDRPRPEPLLRRPRPTLRPVRLRLQHGQGDQRRQPDRGSTSGISYSHYDDTGPGGRPFSPTTWISANTRTTTVNSTFQAGWQWTKQRPVGPARGRGLRRPVAVRPVLHAQRELRRLRRLL